jgi:hypothetical protein
MIANVSSSHRQFEETINTLKYANRAKNLKTHVARNVLSVSAHIAEYQRIIMELRNEVHDLKTQIKGAAPELGPEQTRKQRSLDYVDNLEKQHMQQLRDAIIGALNERRRLLLRLTATAKAVFEARKVGGGAGAGGADGSRGAGGSGAGSSSNGSDAAFLVHSSNGSDAALALIPVPNVELAAALADCRRQLQANQQTINEIVATAVQRISSTERLQLLQLLVRGKFLEVSEADCMMMALLIACLVQLLDRGKSSR